MKYPRSFIDLAASLKVLTKLLTAVVNEVVLSLVTVRLVGVPTLVLLSVRVTPSSTPVTVLVLLVAAIPFSLKAAFDAAWPPLTVAWDSVPVPAPAGGSNAGTGR